MFRRLSSGLPPDPKFPSDLEGLGYFIDKSSDEVRAIDCPKAYFKYFITRNQRYNDAQRYGMDSALREIVFNRLHAQGLETLRLPLGTPQNEPHIPILVTRNLLTAKRIILLLGEHTQDLGVFAYRIIGGKGGINAGSAVDLIKYIQLTMPDTGVIIANLGQLRWWRRGGQAVTVSTWFAVPRKSAVHEAPRFNAIRNTVEGTRDTDEHINYIFNTVILQLCNNKAPIHIIGVSEGSIKIIEFMENMANWEKWGPRLGGLAMLGPYHRLEDIKNMEFVRWLEKRARVYVLSDKPTGMPLRSAVGTTRNPGFGAVSYSAGEPYYVECTLPRAHKNIVDWLKEVGDDGDYENDNVFILDIEDDEVETGWGDVNSETGEGGGLQGDSSPWGEGWGKADGLTTNEAAAKAVVEEVVETGVQEAEAETHEK